MLKSLGSRSSNCKKWHYLITASIRADVDTEGVSRKQPVISVISALNYNIGVWDLVTLPNRQLNLGG